MPPSNKKRELKNRICTYNEKYYSLEGEFKKLQLGMKSGVELTTDTPTSDTEEDDDLKHLNSSCDMEFEGAIMQVEGGSNGNKANSKLFANNQK